MNLLNKKLIKYQRKYIKLLEDELNELVPLAVNRGWETKRYEIGKKLREKIHELT